MKFRICLALIFSLLIVGCGSPRLAVNPAWKNAPEKFTVLISDPYITNSDDITDDFGDSDAFRQWIVSYMNEALTGFTYVAHSVKMVGDDSFVMTQLPLEKGAIGVPLPEVEKLHGIDGIVVSVHPVRFWRETGTCHNRNGCINNFSLNLQVLYSIVSVENMQVLAYGGAYDKSSFTFAMTKGNWESVLEGIAKKIVEKTPLEK